LDALSNNVSSLLNVGCGGGCFVNAVLQKGVDAVDYGNANITKMHEKIPITLVDEIEFYKKII